MGDRTIYRILALALACGCSEPAPTARETAPSRALDQAEPARRAEPPAATDRPAGEQAVAEPRARAISTQPIQVRSAELLSETLFARRKAKRGRVLARGKKIAPTDASGGLDRLLVTAVNRRGKRTVRLIDIASGRQLAEFDGIVDASRPAGGIWAVHGKHQRPTLVRFDNGALVVPAPRVPTGEATDVALHIRGPSIYGPGSPDVWLFAKDAEGAVFHGKWANFDDARPTLSEPFPFWPTRSWTSDRLEVADRSGTPAAPGVASDEPCVHMALGDGRNSVCRARTPETGMVDSPAFLGQGWAIHHGRAYNQETGETQQIFSDCDYVMVHAAVKRPPRALMLCADHRRGPDRDYVLWSPKRRWTWQVKNVGNSTAVQGAVGDPVFPVAPLWESFVPTESWIDLERGVVTEVELLQPANLLSWTDRKVLATRPDSQPIELFLIDLDAGTYRLIARYDDCDGELSNEHTQGDRASLVCRVQERPGYYRFKIRWSEVIDFAAQTRWRTALYPENILPDGRVIASNRKRIAGESRTGANAMFLLELP